MKSHLGTFVRGGLKHPYSLWYCFKGTLWQGGQILDKGWGWRITNICKSCYLHIKCFPANFLAALMWRWYLNSEQAVLQLVVKGSGWCKMGQEEAPKPNLHVYSKNGIEIMVYNMRRCPKKRRLKNIYKKKIKKYYTKERATDSWLYYLGYAEENFYILYLQLFFQTIHNCYLLSKIRLVLSPTLYKFIIWACWAKTQSQAKTGPYNTDKFFFSFDLILAF